MKQMYLDLLNSFPKLYRSRYALKHPDLLKFLDDTFPDVNDLSLKIRCLLRNESPYCIICNMPVKSHGKKTCSIDCRTISQKPYQNERILKHKNTMLKKYGVDNIAKLSSTIVKRKETMLAKHGALVSEKSRNSARNRSNELNIKGRKTLQEKYGVTNPGQLTDHREKCAATLNHHYGVDSYFKTDKFKHLSKQNLMNSYQLYRNSPVQISDITTDEVKQTIFDSPNKIIHFTCNSCGNNDAIPSETYKWRLRETATACKVCAGIINGSLKEKLISDFIEQELYLSVARNARILTGGKEIDIYLPAHNIGIEFNGLYWHNDTRLSSDYHVVKRTLATEQNISLIQIFEDEWDNSQNIVKNKIKQSLCQNNPLCDQVDIDLISVSESNNFIVNNELNGQLDNDINIGLYQDNVLITVVSFNMDNDDWELTNLCQTEYVNPVLHIKMLDYFVSNYSPISIISYTDNRWNDTREHLSFTKIQETEPTCWYFKSNKGKRYLEHELPVDEKHKYLRIWDCGQTIWKWTNKNGTD